MSQKRVFINISGRRRRVYATQEGTQRYYYNTYKKSGARRTSTRNYLSATEARAAVAAAAAASANEGAAVRSPSARRSVRHRSAQPHKHDRLSTLPLLTKVLKNVAGYTAPAPHLFQTSRNMRDKADVCELSFGDFERHHAAAESHGWKTDCIQRARAGNGYLRLWDADGQRTSLSTTLAVLAKLRGNPTLAQALVGLRLPGAFKELPAAEKGRQLAVLEGMTRLRSLDMSGSLAGDENLAKALKGNGTLTALNLSGNRLNVGFVQSLADAIPTMGALASLNLSNTMLATKASGKALAEMLSSNNSGLKELDVSKNAQWPNGNSWSEADGPGFANELAVGLSANGALKKLDISNNGLYAAGGKAIGGALKGNTVMAELNLAGNDTGLAKPSWNGGRPDTSGIMAISNAIPTMGALVKFDISENRLYQACTRAIAEALKGNNRVTELNIAGNYVGKDGGAVYIAKTIPTMGAMTNLHIGSNAIPPDKMNEIITLIEAKPAMKVLCAVPFRDKTITELNVSGQSLGVEGVLVIRRYLENNGAMVKLDVSRNNLRPEGGRALAEALKGNQVIQELNISANSLGLHGLNLTAVTAIANAIPTMGALEKLRMANNDIATTKAGEAIGQALAHNSVLKELDLSNNDIGDGGPGFAKGVADGLRTNGALTSLNISENGIGELVPTEGWSIKNKGFRCQRYVHTDGREQKEAPEMSPVAAIAMANAIKNNGALEKLRIGRNCIIGAEAGAALGDAIATNTALKELDISGGKNEFGGAVLGCDVAFVKAFAAGLGTNGALTSLNISSNKLVPEWLKQECWNEGRGGYFDRSTSAFRSKEEALSGVIALAGAIKTNGALTSLDLRRNDIPNDEQAALERACQRKTLTLVLTPQRR
jgi:Ran GTPase-activating protein (RanGAP) involved in mRNA processing and transport